MEGKETRTKENKAQMLRRLVIKHGHESKWKYTGCEVLYTRLAGRLSRITAGQCFISQAGS